VLKGIFKTVGIATLKRPSLRHTAIQAARSRRRNLILIYHRIGDPQGEPAGLLPTVPLEVFRRQIDALRTLGSIVSLRDLLKTETGYGAVRFAITFDDDDWRHPRFALPALRSMGVHATFFLSGRALYGLGPYWWERLEAALDRHGLARVSRTLEMPADNPAELAAAYERSPASDRLRDLDPPGRDYPALEAGDIRSLADAGLEIGFHTLHHPVLVDLPTSEVDWALVTGRRELSQAAGQPVELFAYPHGKASRAVSQRVERAGYRAAFTGSGRAIGPRSDRFLLSRWEPGSLDGDTLLASVAMRLNLPDGEPRE
jgi:peptidoglycan/xylan/chitin deacetylase (PgdA/CDA1 family)